MLNPLGWSSFRGLFDRKSKKARRGGAVSSMQSMLLAHFDSRPRKVSGGTVGSRRLDVERLEDRIYLSADLMQVIQNGLSKGVTVDHPGEVTLGSFLTIESPTLSFNVTRVNGLYTGSVTITAGSAAMHVGSLTASISPTGTDTIAVDGTYSLNGQSAAQGNFALNADEFSLGIANLFSAHASGVSIGYDPQNTGHQTLASFGGLGMTLTGTDTRFTATATQANADLLSIYNDGFDLAASTATVSNIHVGSFLNVPSLTVTLPAISYQTDSAAAITGSVGLQADSATLVLGTGFTADLKSTTDSNNNSIPGLNGNYDIATHAFSLTVGEATLSIPRLLTATATNFQIGYDPQNTGQQTLASFGSLGLTLTGTDTRFTASATQPATNLLTVYNDGFDLAASTTTVSNIHVGSFLDVPSLTIGLPAVSYQTGSSASITGSVSLLADAATLRLGTGFTAALESTTDSNNNTIPGLNGTYDIETHAFDLTVGQATLSVPSLLTATATNFHVGYDPQNAGQQTLASFGNLTATIHPLNDATVILNSLTINNDGFTLGDGTLTVAAFTLGSVLSITNPTVSISDVSFKVADNGAPEARVGTIGLSGSVSLFPGAGSFTASVSDFYGSYDFQTDTLTAGAAAVDIQVGDFLKFESTNLDFTFGSSFQLTASTVAVSSPRFAGIGGSLGELEITSTGFSAGSVTLGAATTGTPVTIGSVFSFANFQISVTDFSFVYGTGEASFGPDSTLTVSADSVNLSLGGTSAVTASAESISGSIGLGSNDLGEFSFNAGTVQFGIGEYLQLDGSNVGFRTNPGAGQNLADFGSISAVLSLPNILTVSGSARNFSISGAGAFVPGTDFGVSLSTSADASKFGWPKWLPLPQLEELDLTWPDLAADPLNFDLELSGSIHAVVPRTNIQLDGFVHDLRINTSLLVNGQFPITGLGGVGIQAGGTIFGNTFSGAFLLSLLNLDASGDIIEPGATTTAAQRILYGAINANIVIAGMAGFEVRLGMSEYGPLEGYVAASVPIPIPVAPYLAITNFRAGIRFNDALPLITDARQLSYDPELSPQATLTLDEWNDQLAGQVQTQARAVANLPTDPFALLKEPFTLQGGATLVPTAGSGIAFTVDGDILLSLQAPKPNQAFPTATFLINGSVTLGGTFNFGAKLYGNVAELQQGNATFLMNAEVPSAPNQILTVYGGVDFSRSDFRATITGGVEISAFNGVDLHLQGQAVLASTPDRNAMEIQLSGALDLDPLGRLANAGGTIHVQRDAITLQQQFWGAIALRPEQIPGLQDLGVEIDGIAAIRFNSTGLLGDAPQDKLVTLEVPRSDGETETFTFDLPAKSLSLYVAGDINFSRDGAEYFHLGGILDATFAVTSTTYVDLPLIDLQTLLPIRVPVHTYALNVLGAGTLSIGPKASPYAVFNANGFFRMNSAANALIPPGIAARFNVTAATGGSLDGRINASGNLRLDLNTTGHDVQYTVPTGFPDAGSVILVPAAPVFDGNIIGAPTSYLAITGSGSLAVVSNYGLNGSFGLLLTPTELNVHLNASVFAGSLGNVGMAQGILVINSYGIAGNLQGNVGASNNQFSFGGGFQLTVNTTSQSQNLPGFTVDPATGEITTGQLLMTPAHTTRLVIGGHLTVRGMEIFHGEFDLILRPSSLTVGLNASLNAGPLGRIAGVQGGLTIDSSGIFGNVQLALGAGIPGQGFNFGGQLGLAVNDTPFSQTITGFNVSPGTGAITTGQPVSVAPYTVLLVIGGELNVNNAARFVGQFDMSLNTTALYAHAVGSLSIGPRSQPYATFAVDQSLTIISGGLVADIGIQLNSDTALQGLGGALSVNGAARLRINTSLVDANYTVPPGFVNAGTTVVVPGTPPTLPDGTTFTTPMPYIVVTAAGDLTILGSYKLSGSLGLLVTPTKLDAHFNGSLIAGPLGVVAQTQGKLTINLAGIVADVHGTVNAAAGGTAFSYNGNYRLFVDTTSTSSGSYLQIDGNLVAGGFNLAGTFRMTASAAGLTASINASTSVFNQNFTVFGTGGIYANDALGSGGLVLNVDLGAANFTNGPAILNANARLIVNSSPVTRLGISGNTFQVSLTNTDLRMFGFQATGDISVGVSNGLFRIDVPSSAPLRLSFLTFGNLELSGFLASDGTFNLSADGSVNLLTEDGNWGVYVGGTIHFSNAGIYGRVDGVGRAAGLTLASVWGDLILEQTHYRIRAQATVLGVTYPAVDFNLTVPGTPPSILPPLINFDAPAVLFVTRNVLVTVTVNITQPGETLIPFHSTQNPNNLFVSVNAPGSPRLVPSGLPISQWVAGQPMTFSFQAPTTPGEYSITVETLANTVRGQSPWNSRSLKLVVLPTSPTITSINMVHQPQEGGTAPHTFSPLANGDSVPSFRWRGGNLIAPATIYVLDNAFGDLSMVVTKNGAPFLTTTNRVHLTDLTDYYRTLYFSYAAPSDTDVWTILPDGPGDYQATLVATHDGQQVSSSTNFRVTAVAPVITGIDDPPDTDDGAILGSLVTFTARTVDLLPVTYHWTAITSTGFPIAAGSERSFTFPMVGQPEIDRPGVSWIMVTMTATNSAGLSASQQIPINVIYPELLEVVIEPSFNASGLANGYGDYLLRGIVSQSVSDAPLTYSWSTNNVSARFGTRLSVAPYFVTNAHINPVYYSSLESSPTVVYLTVTNTQTGKSRTTSTVDPILAITGAPSTGTQGTSITLGSVVNVMVPGASPVSYLWTVNGNPVSGGSDMIFTPGLAGPYLVELSVTDSAGHTGRTGKLITVPATAPTLNIIGAPATAGAGVPVVLGSLVSHPSPVVQAAGYLYSWQVLKNGNSFATGANANLTFTPDGFGTYVVNLSATNADALTATSTVTILNLNANGGTTTVLTSPGGASVYGQAVRFIATVTASSAGFGALGGTVAFYNGSTLLDTQAPNANGQATSKPITGLAAGVYQITAVYSGSGTGVYFGSTSANLGHTVQQAVLTITANNQSMVYGSMQPMLTATMTGFQYGETLATSGVTGAPHLTTVGSGSSAGSYAIFAGTGTLTGTANYRLSAASVVDGTLTILRAPLTITADDQTMEHAGSLPAMTASYNGLVNGDLPSSITGVTFTTTSAASNPGSYGIAISGATNANYVFTLRNGTLTIHPPTPTLSNLSLTVAESDLVVFDALDFDAALVGPFPVQATYLQITSLPAHGVLQLGGIAATVGQNVARSALSSLVYIPDAQFTGTDQFLWTAAAVGQRFAAVSALAILDVRANVVVLSDFTLNTPQAQTITFTANNFAANYHDHVGLPLRSVLIRSLPTGGTLNLAGVAVTVGQNILAGSLSNLTYIPNPDFSGSDGFTWNGSSISADPAAVVNIVVQPEVIQLQDIAITTLQAVTLPFASTDFVQAFTDSIPRLLQSVRVSSLPSGGTLQLSGEAVTVGQEIIVSALANLSYLPYGWFVGLDRFTWQASSGLGFGTSVSTATINVWAAANPVTLVSGLIRPPGVAVDSAGNVYIADQNTRSIKVWNAATQVITTLIGGLNGPSDVAVDAVGNVYVATTGYTTNSGAVWKWNAATGQLSTLVGGLSDPQGVAVDATGNVYIANTKADSVLKWNAITQQVTTLVSGRAANYSWWVRSPTGVAVDQAGNVYIASPGYGQLQVWNATTNQISVLRAYGDSNPNAVALDQADNVYVAVTNTIDQWNATTHQYQTVADGLNYPGDLAVDGFGNIYIADTYNNAIKVRLNAHLSVAPLSIPNTAGSDVIVVTAASTLSLTGPLAPSSNQSWLTLGTPANNIVPFTFTANSGPARTAIITVLGRQITVTQPAALVPTIITINAPSATYGENAVITVTATSLGGTPTGTVLLSVDGGTPYAQPLLAGSGTFVISGLTAGNHTLSASYATSGQFEASTASATLIVGKATLTITANDDSKIYGTLSTFSSAAFTVTGLVTAHGDTITGVTASSDGAVISTSVGSYSVVAGAATGTGLSNYTINYISGTLLVNPATLTITANNDSKTYGTLKVFASSAFTWNGLVTANGDTVTGISEFSSTGSTVSATVGNYSIQISDATGTGLSNYTISYTGGTLTVDPATLTVTVDNKAKIYGEANPMLTYAVTGLVAGDANDVVSGVVLSTATGASATAGDHAITANSGVASNYTVIFVSGNLHVDKASLTVTADNKNKIYGGVDPLLTYTPGGTLYYSDSYSVITGVALSTATGASATAGDHAITASGGVASNYTVTFVSGNLHVEKASLTVTADSKSKIYGGGDPSLTYTADGTLHYSDSFSVITGVALSTTTGGFATAGDHLITASGGVAANYNVNFVSGNLHVDKASLTVTANNKSKIYGSVDPLLTYTPDGTLFYSDSYSVISGVALSTATGAAATAGDHPITASGGVAANYSVIFVGGNLHVDKASLTVTADNKSKVYGSVDPMLTYTPGGPLFYSDSYSVITGVALSTKTGAAATAGNHAVIASSGVAANYRVIFVGGNLHVDKASLTVTADNKLKFHGGSDPPLTYTASGTLFYNDSYTVISGISLSTTTGATATVGRHVIFATGGSASNYTVNNVNGTLLVVINSSQGILLLDATGKGALTVSGNGRVSVKGGEIVVDSSSTQAVKITGNGSVSATKVDTKGLSISGKGTVNGTVNTTDTPTANPLATLPTPSVPSIVRSSVTMNISGGQVTLQPGLYIGGIKISGNVQVILAAGIYYFQGGGFSVSGQATVTGANVMLYNAPAKPSDSISFTGQGAISLSGMERGIYQGIAIFQDRLSTASINLSGKGNVNITGSLYAAAATLNLTGNGSLMMSGDVQKHLANHLIVADLNVTGNGGVSVDVTNNVISLVDIDDYFTNF